MFNAILLAAFCLFVFALSVFAQAYPSEVEINLPEPSAIFQFQKIEALGKKAMNFFGVEVFARELQNIDLAGFLEKGRSFAAEKATLYRAELRRFCPSGCSLPEIFRSIWSKMRSKW